MELAVTASDSLLLTAALVFAVVSGVNDGGTLLALGTRVPALPLLWALVIAAGSIVASPLVLGMEVARTFLERLVEFGDRVDESILIAVAAALVVALLLGRRGIPTSLTVAILGGLVGSGVGQGLDVRWATTAVVVAVGLVTPVVGALVAYGVVTLAAQLGPQRRAGRLLRRAHVAAFTLQSLAYGANDGQKMFAVYAAATAVGSASGGVELSFPELLLIAAAFTVGAVAGLRRYARTVGLSVVPTRPFNAVVAELSAAVAVTGTGVLGSPVSSTQSVVTSLVGSDLHEGYHRVRWGSVVRIVFAWFTTFPLALVVGVALGWAV